MLSLSPYPIKTKLILITMVSTAVALVLASIAIIIYEIIDTEDAIKKELSILTSIIGDRSSAALVFNDQEYARENLSALKAKPSITSACLYTNNGSVFASYSRDQSNENSCKTIKQNNYHRNENSELENSRIYHSHIRLSQAINLDDELIGYIRVQFDTGQVKNHIIHHIAIITITFLLAVLVAYFLSLRLQHVISSPINQLGDTAKHIAKHHDYSSRAVKQNDDELGLLVDMFNNMLETIEEKNMTVIATKERYRIMYDDNPAMLVTVSSDGEILSINKFGAEQSGYTLDELIGRSLLDIVHNEDKETVLENIKRCLSLPDDIHIWKTRLVHKNKSILWTKNKARFISNNSGKPIILLMSENITEEHTLTEQLNFHASHDALTGLVNRREFERRTEQLIPTIQQGNSNHAICFMDLDQFKIVNDTCGHIAGDELLRQLSSILKHSVRHRDTLARLGGDEFGLLMEHCSLDDAHRIATSLLKTIQDYQFTWEGHSFRVGVSIGLIHLTETTDNLTELMKNADAACYMAKDKGRNRIQIYHADDAELSQRHSEMQWITRINKALEENRFCLYAQSIGPLNESTDKHYELLIRMIDEKGKIIPPGAFLPAAERYNLITKIDRWVIENAFGLLRDYPEFLKQIHFISINLSGQSLADETIHNFIIDQLAATNVPPGKVCFEITETAAISNLNMATTFIASLKELGCQFALDDFGSGLSSFAYLKNLPVDYLKIDGMFVKDIVEDKIDHAMVKSINEIGHVMGMQTIAEFVENDEIKGMLREIGVNYAQGYGIAKPLPFNELLGRSSNVIDICKAK